MKKEKAWDRKTGAVHCIGQCEISDANLINYLGKEHYTETDPLSTHSGVERFWVFEVEQDIALAFQYADMKKILNIGLNKDIEDPKNVVKKFLPVSYEASSGLMWE